MEKLADMRKNFVADRVRDKQDIVYVEEKGRALLSFRRSENRVIMSGDKARLRKIQEADPVIMDYLRNLFLGPEEDTEMEFSTDEDRVDLHLSPYPAQISSLHCRLLLIFCL